VTRLQEIARERAEMLEAAPVCEEETCEAKVVESEVHAWVRLPQYPGIPSGPLGDPRPAAYLHRCQVGHEIVRCVSRG